MNTILSHQVGLGILNSLEIYREARMTRGKNMTTPSVCLYVCFIGHTNQIGVLDIIAYL